VTETEKRSNAETEEKRGGTAAWNHHLPPQCRHHDRQHLTPGQPLLFLLFLLLPLAATMFMLHVNSGKSLHYFLGWTAPARTKTTRPDPVQSKEGRKRIQ